MKKKKKKKKKLKKKKKKILPTYFLNVPEINYDRPIIENAFYGEIDVTNIIKQRHTARRLRIIAQVPLNELFDTEIEAKLFKISFSYNSIKETISINVIKRDQKKFLERDLVVPNNLDETSIPESHNEPWNLISNLLLDKVGIEVGGPSGMFHREVPVYPILKSLDNVNFASKTLWESNLEHDVAKFQWYEGKPLGRQFVLDVTNLQYLRDKNYYYDVILSCHMLEHLLNPLKAVREMVSVIKPGGYFLLIVPYKAVCFDHFRDYTKMEDLLNHWEQKHKENNLDHLDEILQLHDLPMDAAAGTLEQFRARSLKNEENRGLHQHIFHPKLSRQVCEWAGLKPIIEGRNNINMYTLCVKP